MKNGGGVIMDYLLNPRPTLFDLCASLGVVGIVFIPPKLYGFYFCFYSAFITIIGFYCKRERNFVAPELTLLSLIALSGLFIHSFLYKPKSVTFLYFNFMLMFEGFGYIFFGSLLFHTLVNNGKNLKLFYITLPIMLIPTIKLFLYSGRGSIIFAIGMAVIIYLIKVKKYKLATLAALIVANVLAWNWPWFYMKWACRIPVWSEQIFGRFTFPAVGIKQHPFIGHGFNKLFCPDFSLYILQFDCILLQHNDYLNIINILGIFSVIPIVMFLRHIYGIVKDSWYLIPVLSIAILCFVQMTIFLGDKALAIVSFLSLAVVENQRG